MNAARRPVATPTIEMIMGRAARRKMLGNSAPMTPGANGVHPAVDDFPQNQCSFVAAPFGWRYQRRDHRPLLIYHIIVQTSAACWPPAS